MSKLQAGKLTLEKINFNLREIIENILNQSAVTLIQKQKEEIIIEYEILNNSIIDNFELIGDPNRLKQILSNLIDNAIKFTKKDIFYLLFK